MQDMTVYQESPLEVYGRVADEQARQNTLQEYQRNLTPATLRRHKADLVVFQRFLHEKTQMIVEDMFASLVEWQGITWGTVYAFQDWMIEQGYAMGSVDVRLVTVKKYMRMAQRSGYVSAEDVVRLIDLKGHDAKVRRNIDLHRNEDGIKTRIGRKKASPTLISVSHLQALRQMLMQDNTYIGRRDLLLLCLLGYHGLRCSEVHDLKRENIDLTGGMLQSFYRRKVDLTQNHMMHGITLMSAHRYLEIIPALQEMLFVGVDREPHTSKSGKEYVGSRAEDGLSERSINDRVRYLGRLVGIEKLSPHDLRHFCNDDLFKNKTPIEIAKEFSGWKTYAMPEHYRQQRAIANEGALQSSW